MDSLHEDVRTFYQNSYQFTNYVKKFDTSACKRWVSQSQGGRKNSWLFTEDIYTEPKDMEKSDNVCFIKGGKGHLHFLLFLCSSWN
jgi:hypothetical protein